MIGVLVSSKTLRGEPNKYPKLYPKIGELKDVLTGYPHALNLVHYNTDTPEHLCAEMRHVRSLSGEHCHGFQLNVAWPSISDLNEYHYGDYGFEDKPPRQDTIVLQIGSRAIEQRDKSPRMIAEQVREYGKLIDYVLIDPSGGTGKEFDESFVFACRQQLDLMCPEIGVGVAGGLKPDNLERKLGDLFRHYPDTSFDTQSGVHDKDGHLLISHCKTFIEKGKRLYKQYAPV